MVQDYCPLVTPTSGGFRLNSFTLTSVYQETILIAKGVSDTIGTLRGTNSQKFNIIGKQRNLRLDNAERVSPIKKDLQFINSMQ